MTSEAVTLDAGDLSGSQDLAEIGPAAAYLAGRAPAVVLEIGAFTGASLRVWAALASPMATLIAVDTDPARVRPFARPGQTGIVIGGDSLAPETFAEVRTALAGRAVDFLFIDGDHARPLADFECWSPLVRPGGLVGFHDIAHPDMPGFATSSTWRALKARFADSVEFVNPNRGAHEAMGIGVLVLLAAP